MQTEEIDLTASGNEVHLQTEQEITLETSENVIETKSPSPEVSLCNIEKKMSDVVLDEKDQAKEITAVADCEPKSSEDVEMPEEIKESIEPEPVPADPVESDQLEVKIKQEETSEILDEAFANNFMDVEDTPFVRRSRRLKSTHIETFPIKLEEPATPALAITYTIQEARNAEMSFPRAPENFPQAAQNDQGNQQEMVAKPAPEIHARVDNHAVCLQRYETIRENIYSKKSDKKVCKVNKTMKCDCTITEEEIKSGELGCQYNCINRILYIECGPKCRCGGENITNLYPFNN